MKEYNEMTDKEKILGVIKKAYVIDYVEIKKITGLSDRVTKKNLDRALTENLVEKKNFKIKGIGGKWVRKYISRM